MIPKLDLSEERLLLAAEGWLELGNSHEAVAELENLSPSRRDHPLVLCLRWQICARAGQWETAVELARKISEILPDDPFGWVHWAFALHELKQTREAYAVVASVVANFSEDPTMRYNLACYACQLGDFPESMEWLKLAMNLAGDEDIRVMALTDPDLQPLWPEIKNL